MKCRPRSENEPLHKKGRYISPVKESKIWKIADANEDDVEGEQSNSDLELWVL